VNEKQIYYQEGSDMNIMSLTFTERQPEEGPNDKLENTFYETTTNDKSLKFFLPPIYRYTY
jgi:hypothetical protein